MFKVEVIGNLGADAEIKEANGARFVSFRIADTQKFKDQAGNEQTETNWIDCTMSNVESKVIQYLKAGVKVFVRGNASLRVYSSQKDRCMKAGLKVFVLFLCLVFSKPCKKETQTTKRMNLILVQKALKPKVSELFVIVHDLKMNLFPDIFNYNLEYKEKLHI